MYIDIQSIPHREHRYDTLGDYYYSRQMTECGRERLNIRVSKIDNENYSYLVAMHELIEAWLCQKRGISVKDIDDFDMKFKGEGEPGDEIDSPYYKEHQFATKIEKMLCEELGIKWEDYEQALAEVCNGN